MKDTVLIIASLLLGITVGYFVDLPFELKGSPITEIILCILLFFVGMSIGSDSKTLHAIRHLHVGLILVPFITIIGSLIGSFIVFFFLSELSVYESLAIGSGLGYYSISSVIIGDKLGPALAAVALFSNVLREMITLILVPVIRKFFGPIAPIACGGANTSDVVLPVIMRHSGEEYAVPSIYNGIVCTFIVPFLVTFFCEQHLALMAS